MRVNILHLGPAEFFDRKSDIIYGLFHAITDLGHEVTIGHHQIRQNCLNLIVGSDVAAYSANAINKLESSLVDCAIYEVENFNGTTINYRPNFPIDNYLRLLRAAKFIITPYAYNVPNLEEVCGKDKIIYARWGFHGSMKRDNITRNRQFTYDALFFGLIKGAREKKYQIMRDRCAERVKVITESDPFTIRDYAVSTSHYGLALSYGETDDFVNPFRLYYMVGNGMPVLADHINDEDQYLEICEAMTFDEILNEIDSKSSISSRQSEMCYANSLTANLRGIL
jgi:hypothetical protein